MIATALFWEFLLVTVVLYWALPDRFRPWFLAAASLAYLAIDAPHESHVSPLLHAAVLGVLAVLCYAVGPRTATPRKNAKAVEIETKIWPAWMRNTAFWGLIALILGYLYFTKYTLAEHYLHSAAGTYVLPLGVSYIAFKLIHTLVEFARGTIKHRTISSYFAGVFIFPTLAAGPIERYDHFLANRATTLKSDDLLQGLTRIVVGIIKRFFVADYFFGQSWDFVLGGHFLIQLSEMHPYIVWKSLFFCVFYMYLDFSAYSDIAIGCCRLFGITIMENFNWPLTAPNLPAFWRRWHMTLTGWCQAYVFLPVLGLTRIPEIATFATFLVIGLWHGSAGATWPWVLWGCYHGVGMVGHQQWSKVKRKRKWTWCNRWWWYAAGVAMTLSFVSIGDLLALSGPTSIKQVITILERLVFIGPAGRS